MCWRNLGRYRGEALDNSKIKEFERIKKGPAAHEELSDSDAIFGVANQKISVWSFLRQQQFNLLFNSCYII